MNKKHQQISKLLLQYAASNDIQSLTRLVLMTMQRKTTVTLTVKHNHIFSHIVSDYFTPWTYLHDVSNVSLENDYAVSLIESVRKDAYVGAVIISKTGVPVSNDGSMRQHAARMYVLEEHDSDEYNVDLNLVMRTA